MTSADRPQLAFGQPPNWDSFEETVEREWGATSPYVGFVLDRTWREFREEHPAEELVTRLVEAAGLRERDTREKSLLTRDVSGSGDGRVWYHVHPETKSGMEAYATEAGVPNHVVLRAVVWWYLDGGLLGRLTEKLERAVPDAEEQLAELDPSADRGQTSEDKKPRWLVKELTPGGFTLSDFGDALEAMPWRGGDTEHMRGEWLEPVLSRAEYAEHPNKSGLYIPEEQAEEMAEKQGIDRDGPAIDRGDYADLTDPERVRGLRVELARRATNRRNGKRALNASKVRSDVFDGTPGTRKTKDLMDRAARIDGFNTDGKGGEKRLRVDLNAVEDAEVWDALEDENTEEPDAPPGQDAEDGETDPEDPVAEAKERMDALTSAEVATDGGRDRP